MADMQAELHTLKDWREKTVDPKLEDHEKRIDKTESILDKTEGKFKVIIWLNGVIITLLVGILLSLFTWVLNHVTFHVEATPPVVSQSQQPQDAVFQKHQVAR